MVDEARKQEAAQWVARGAAALNANKVKIARKCLLKARELDPENVDALLWLTRTTADPGKRAAILRQVLKIEPGHPGARRALARLRQQLAERRSEAGPAADIPRFIEEEEQEPGAPSTGPSVAPPAVEPPPVEPVLKAPAEETPVGAEEMAPEAWEAEAVEVSAAGEAPLSSAAPPVGEVAGAEEATEVEQPPLSLPDVEELAPMPAAEAVTEAGEGATEAAAAAEVTATEEDLVDAMLAELATTGTGELVPSAVAEAPPPIKQERCPRCNAVMRTNERTGSAYCVFCGYGMVGDQPAVLAARKRPEQPWPDIQQARHCLTCDTISIAPVERPSHETPCPLCQQSVFEGAPSMPLPDSYLPFKISEAQAAIALEDIGTGALQRLFGGRRDLSRPRRAYLAIWRFSGVGQVAYEFPGYEDLGGVYTENYPAVVIHGLRQIDGELLRVASNVDLDDASPYQAEVGRESFVLLSNMSLHTALHEARGLMLNDTRQRARERIRPSVRKGDKRAGALDSPLAASASRGDAAMTIVSSDVQDMVYEVMLLPVWINEVREGNRLRMGLVNGYTGQAAVGQLVRRQRP